LSNVIVRQPMRAWTANPFGIAVQVFDILNATQVRDGCISGGAHAKVHRTFQDVCSYYDLRMVVHSEW
jgi:hypothetical protein